MKISVIIPVIGNPPYFERCLASIRAQNYPQDKVEIIVAHGDLDFDRGYTESRFLMTCIFNPHKTAEKGKQLALQHATGDFVCFLDSDNVLVNKNYFAQAVEVLNKNNSLLGVEASYCWDVGMSSLCYYLTVLLHISDPVSLALTNPPYYHGNYKDFGKIYSRSPRRNFPLGSNGFIFRRSDLVSVDAHLNFEDTEVANRIDKHVWIRIPAVAHFYTTGLWNFICKRRRQTYHYLNRPRAMSHWTVSKKPFVFFILLSHATFIIPLIATWNLWKRYKQWECLWHPIASLASVIGLVWGCLTWKCEESKLQPKQ